MRNLLLSFIAVLFLTGCVQQNVIDDLNIALAFGIDVGEGEKIKGTAVVPIFSTQTLTENTTFTSESKYVRDVVNNIQRQSSAPVAMGSLEVFLIGREFAVKKGIEPLAETIKRDPTVGSRLFLAISNTTAEEVLEGDYGKIRTGLYLSNLIEHNTKRLDTPKTNLHIFISQYYQKGKDPYLPVIKKISNNKVNISGMALFKKDKLVDILPAKDMFVFKLLVDRHNEGEYSFTLKKNQRVTVRSIHSKNKIKVRGPKQNPKVTVHLEISGNIKEITHVKDVKKITKEVNKKMESLITEDALRLIKQFQQEEMDPIGIGYMVKAHTRKFDFKKWEDQYKDVQIDVKTKVKLLESGITD